MFNKARQLAASIRFHLRVNQLADRKYLREVMLPEMATLKPSNVLLAGVRRYNVDYPREFDSQATIVWTLDYDTRAARWGNGQLHKIGDICETDSVFPGIRFDIVHINGLLGFGIEAPEQIEQMVDSVHRALLPNGYMMLGWDADTASDPLEYESIKRRFIHAKFGTLPKRHSVVGLEGHAHTFDWFRSVAVA